MVNLEIDDAFVMRTKVTVITTKNRTGLIHEIASVSPWSDQYPWIYINYSTIVLTLHLSSSLNLQHAAALMARSKCKSREGFTAVVPDP